MNNPAAPVNVNLNFVYLAFTQKAVAKQTLFPALLPVLNFG